MGKITKNSIILILKEGVLNISSIFVVGYLARKLGAENYGKLTFSISFGVLLSIISNLGIRQYATREVVRYKDKAKEIYGEIIFTRFFLSIIMVLSGLIISIVAGYDEQIIILIIIALISKGFFAFTSSSYIIFEAYEDMQYNALTQTISRGIIIVLILIALLLDAGLFVIAAIYLFCDVLQFIISFGILRKNYFKPILVRNVQYSIKLIKKSVPFALFSIFTLIYFEIGKVMLFQLGTSESVGLFQAASVLTFKVLIVSDSVGTAIFPRIVELRKTDLKKYQKLSIKAIGIMFGLGIVAAISIYFLADFIINIIYHSQEYLPSIRLLQAIVWVLPLMFVSKILSFLLVAQDYQKLLASIYFIIVIINICLNFVFIPTYGAIGAIWSLILAEVSGMIIFALSYKKLNLFSV